MAKRAAPHDATPPVFQSVTTETLAGRVGRELIDSILSGRFPPGTLLPTEERLCEQFGVSRSVIREAMRAVASVGMARSRQGRGTEVLDRRSWNDFAPELLAARQATGDAGRTLAELLELRASIEPQAAEIAAIRVTSEDLAAMTTHHEALQAAQGRDEFIRSDIAFHAAILAATGNELIVRLFDLLEPLLVMARGIGHDAQAQPAGVRSSIKEHAKILTAIKDGTPDVARQAMFEHLRWLASRELHHELGQFAQ